MLYSVIWLDSEWRGKFLSSDVSMETSTLRDKIIPRAVSWFTGEAAEQYDDTVVAGESLYDEYVKDGEEDDEEGDGDEEDDVRKT
ncbi:2-like [Dorcoceras hygrometricum]|uniref:2-like n=1 Tax=Dorcoceras hygrometricum TaxID=472368 RepID=A0A2Z7B4N7_9LAMI|nr:2-like [Dorcoceras hygrometricum]